MPDARARFIAIIEILLCSSVPTQLAIGAILKLAGWASVDAAGHLSFGFVFILSLADTLLVIALMVVFMRVHGERSRRLWLGDRPFTREVLIGLLAVPIILVAVGILLNALRLALPWLHNVQTNPLEGLAGSPAQAAMFAIVAIVAGGVREELQRAFMLHRFEQYLGGADGRRGRDQHRLRHPAWCAGPRRDAHDGCAWRVLGGRVLVAAQQHRADDQPRGIQLPGNPSSGDGGTVGSGQQAGGSGHCP